MILIVMQMNWGNSKDVCIQIFFTAGFRVSWRRRVDSHVVRAVGGVKAVRIQVEGFWKM